MGVVIEQSLTWGSQPASSATNEDDPLAASLSAAEVIERINAILGYDVFAAQLVLGDVTLRRESTAPTVVDIVMGELETASIRADRPLYDAIMARISQENPASVPADEALRQHPDEG